MIFPLQPGARARLGFVAGGLSLILTLVVLVTTGSVLVLGFAVAGSALGYLLGGAPRSIEVHHDRVVLRSWLRAPRTLVGSALFVQQMPDELVLVHEGDTFAIVAEQFVADGFARCCTAMRPMAGRFIQQVVRRPRRD